MNLYVVMRIPVHIINDDCVGWRKIDAKATSTRWQQKYKLLWVGACKVISKNPALAS